MSPKKTAAGWHTATWAAGGWVTGGSTQSGSADDAGADGMMRSAEDWKPSKEMGVGRLESGAEKRAERSQGPGSNVVKHGVVCGCKCVFFQYGIKHHDAILMI